MSDHGDDVRMRFRHEARTILNHVVGFGELLAQDSLADDDPDTVAVFHAIGNAAIALRQPVLEYIGSVMEGAVPSLTLKRQVYDRIYDLVSLVQVARRDIPANHQALKDVHKVHEATNALADLFEEADSLDDTMNEHPALSRMLAPTEHQHLAGRMLVVDDEPFNREILARFLERQGHVVCQAANGRDAFAILSEAPFDIVLLDVMMP
ncbi:MAG: response regulator, partial [Spirochaetales bacterium]|nr:response regulator [Spirochaetales bacterium]